MINELRIVQDNLSPGFGGLEIVMMEFHEWLLGEGIDARAIVLKGSRLEKEFQKRFPAKSIYSTSSNLAGRIQEFKIRKSLDGPNTAHLFHRHRDIKSLLFKKLKGKVTVLTHTFISVDKKDFMHKLHFNRVDRWIALTPLHKINLHERLGISLEKIYIVPNGVLLEKFKALKQREKPNERWNIGVVARLDGQKGQDIAIRSLQNLKQQNILADLYFYGEDTPDDPPYSPFLKNLAKECDVEDQVHFKGFSSAIEKDLQDLDLLWMPSHKETFGRCIVEAMVGRVPVIASAAGGVPDIIQDKKNGILFKTKDSEDLAVKTIELMKNPELREKIIEEAYLDVVNTFDQNRIWKKLFSCINGTELNQDAWGKNNAECGIVQ